MVNLLALVSQPLIVVVAALALFIGRTILHAHRLKTAAKDPELAKLMSGGESSNLLKMHKESLANAKDETTATLASARGTMHNYRRVFKRSKQRND